ncbi:hypothetical protein MOMA_06696 [Moraxella macacae 0408225]|uniref:DUF4124 domain-containing protein n=2 Tax=Moraxella macacae TaxID=765840 RepID=L2F5A0_9GAMM|nr:hypothetical protein MOMA_06696 [Moraxella macacae 0408225]
MKYLGLLILSITALNTHANNEYYYGWTDASGTSHYTQYHPSNGVDANKVKEYSYRNNFHSVAPVATQANNSTQALTPEQQRIAELEAKNKAQQAEQDKERCKSLQNKLSNLQAGGRVYEMSDKGERKYLDGREIELKRQETQQAINQYCK